MTERNYAIEIKRTACGAFDDYYYHRLGRKLRSQAFHAFMKRIWRRFAREDATPASRISVGMRCGRERPV